MTLSEDDLVLVGAFHDGELDPADAARIRDRLAREPELREALAGIREVSAALKALRPGVAPLAEPAPRPARHRKLAMAAAVAAAVALGGLVFGLRAPAPGTPLRWHEHFVAQSYTTDGRLDPVPVSKWIGQEPDLASANLTLVDVAREGPRDLFLHYSGVNGCRLTFSITALPATLSALPPALLVETWSDGELNYSVLAIGMDRGRFRAIAELLRGETRDEPPGTQLFAAVRDATRQGAPCA